MFLEMDEGLWSTGYLGQKERRERVKNALKKHAEKVLERSAVDAVLEETEARVERVEFPGLPGAGMDTVPGPDGKPYVVVKRICEVLGVDEWTQQKRLKSYGDSWYRDIPVPDLRGRQQLTFCIPLNRLAGWLYRINPAKVAESKRAVLEKFQEEATDVLYRHFGLGGPGEPVIKALLADMGKKLEAVQAESSELRRSYLESLSKRDDLAAEVERLKNDPIFGVIGAGLAEVIREQIRGISGLRAQVQRKRSLASIRTEVEQELRGLLKFPRRKGSGSWDFLPKAHYADALQHLRAEYVRALEVFQKHEPLLDALWNR